MHFRWIVVFIAAWLISLGSYAQKYSTAAGLRVDGDLLGITVKQRVFRTIALEGMLTGNDTEMRGTLLVENHYPLVGKGLNFYIGGGGHLGGVDEFGPVAGLDAIMGAELKIPLLRLLVSADVKPAYNFTYDRNSDVQKRLEYSTAISVRYVLGKEGKSQRKKARIRRKNKREKEKTKSTKLKEREKQKREKLKERQKTKRAKYKEKTKRLKEKNKAKRKKQKEKRKGERTFRDWKIFQIFKSDS